MRTPRPVRTLLVAIPLLSGIPACGSSSSSVAIDGPVLSTVQLPAELTLAPGGSFDLANAGLRVKFETVVGDSRCPSSVVCVWAGAVVLRLTASRLVSLISDRSFTLSTEPGKDTATVYGQPLRLLRVDPPRGGTAAIPLSAYRAVIKVGADR